VGDAAVVAVARGCRELERLEIRYVPHVTAAALEEVGDQCPRLKQFTVAAKTPLAVASVALRCPLLEFVSIEGPPLTDAALTAVAQGCPRLRILHVNFSDITSAALVAIAKRCPLLENLCCSSVDVADLSVGVAAIGKGCPRLKTLILSSFTETVDESAWLALASGCPRLELLDISGQESEGSHGYGNVDTGVTDNVLAALAKGAPLLRHIEIVGDTENISDEGAMMVGCLPLMRRLYLPRCFNVHNWGMKEIDKSRKDANLPEVKWRCFGDSDVSSDEE